MKKLVFLATLIFACNFAYAQNCGDSVIVRLLNAAGITLTCPPDGGLVGEILLYPEFGLEISGQVNGVVIGEKTYDLYGMTVPFIVDITRSKVAGTVLGIAFSFDLTGESKDDVGVILDEEKKDHESGKSKHKRKKDQERVQE